MEAFLAEHGYLSLFALSFLASTILPIGSEGLLIALLLQGSSPFFTVSVATLGNALGACTTYAIGYYGGALLITRVLRVSPEALEQTHRRYKRYGAWSLLFSWVPVIGDPLCLVSGILKSPFPLFLILMAVGKLARYVFVTIVTLASTGGCPPRP